MVLAVRCSECDADVPAYSRYLSQAKYEPLIDLIGVYTIDGCVTRRGAPIGAYREPSLLYDNVNGRIFNTNVCCSPHWLCYSCDLGVRAPWLRPKLSKA